MSFVTLKPVWTIIPLIDQTTFEKRVLRAFPFAAKVIEGTERGVMQGKTRHWQAAVLHFSAQFPLQKCEEEDPRTRFERLRKMEQSNGHPKMIRMREGLKEQFRSLSLDYVNLLDEVDDYESFINEDYTYSDTVPTLTLAELRVLTDQNSFYNTIDYVVLDEKFTQDFERLEYASQLNESVRKFALVKELYEPEIACKISKWMRDAHDMLNDPELDEPELKALLTMIKAYDNHVSFINSVTKLRKEIKHQVIDANPKIKSDFEKSKKYLNVVDKAYHLLLIRNNLKSNEPIPSKMSQVQFNSHSLQLISYRYQAAYEGLRKLEGVTIDDLSEWFIEVRESIEKGDFERAEQDFVLMKETFFNNSSVVSAIKKHSSVFFAHIRNINNFRSDAFFKEIRSLFSTEPLEKAFEKLKEPIEGYKLSDLELEMLKKWIVSSKNLEEAFTQFKIELEKKHNHNKTNFRLSALNRTSDPLTSIQRFLNLVERV